MKNLQEVVGWNTDTGGGHTQGQGRSSKADEFHAVSTIYQSGFYRFTSNFQLLENLISEIQRKTLGTASIKNEAFRRQFESMLIDLKYVLEKINLLENSHDPRISEELLHELMDTATDPSAYDFLPDSNNLYVLLRLILKLKLLLPTKQVYNLQASGTTREKKLQFTRRKSKERDVTDNDVEDSQKMGNLRRAYRSLNDTERKCLLCFSVFFCSEGRHEREGFFKRNNSLVMKKRMLIEWWVGEGFIDPQDDNDCSFSATSQNPYTKRRNQNMRYRTRIRVARYAKTSVELGNEIFEALEKNQFIETLMNRGRDSGSCCMSSTVLSFVSVEAKKDRFSDYGQGNGKLSQRVCLWKSQDSFPSSCKLLEECCSKRLGSLNTVCALLNINEPIIDIGAKWFCRMTDLLVLHLGSWDSHNGDHIEVVDQKFLEDLKSMKQLRLLSLQGFSAITKLPDSVCELANLRILNLRDCSYLEELPTDIESLKNLIHLDVTQCRFLSMLPKGVRLLSKLEVLKGMVVTFQADGKQHEKAFVLKDLLKLGNLNKLSLVVNKEDFPVSKDLQILKQMMNLCNLKITWEKSYIIFEESEASTAEEASMHSRWEWLKCWGSQEAQNDIRMTRDRSDLLYQGQFESMKRLVLCCFPTETAPEWLDPSKFKKLEKLYIVGGNLQTLRGTHLNTWNVNVLRLKYLRNLQILWPELRGIFPNIAYLENHQCDKLTRFPCDEEGVWTIEIETKGTEELIVLNEVERMMVELDRLRKAVPARLSRFREEAKRQ